MAILSAGVQANIPQIGDDYKTLKNVKVDDNALVICFIFLALGIGSIFKEINKRHGVMINEYDFRYPTRQCYS